MLNIFKRRCDEIIEQQQTEIDELKKTIIHVADELAKELHSNKCTEAQEHSLYRLARKLRNTAAIGSGK